MRAKEKNVNILDLEPKECFRWFAEICTIPHGSGKEKALSDFIVAFAEKRGLTVTQDKLHNVLIRKPGCHGLEKAPTVTLQAHIDMVWAKEHDLAFDFETRGIETQTDGKTLTAKGTTLGADNGIGAAFILALLDSADLPHPPLEGLFTTQEEVGLAGAREFDAGLLKGERFINIDTEEEGVFCASCASGRRCVLDLPADRENVNALPGHEKYGAYRVTVEGLAGGHSGLEIHKGRGNANRLLIRTLAALAAKFDTRLTAMEGGTAANVIPSQSHADICITESRAALAAELAMLRDTFANELKAADGAGLAINLTPLAMPEKVLTKPAFTKCLAIGLLIPDGVLAYDLAIKSGLFVETSHNFAMVGTTEKSIRFSSSIRSSLGSKKLLVFETLAALASLVCAELTWSGDYPAWEYAEHSPLRDAFAATYRRLSGREPRIEGVHAGLECGIFYQNFKDSGRTVDFISFGPNLQGVHSAKESLDVASVGRVWRLLTETLKTLA